MQRVRALIDAFDAAIQKRFDSVIHRLMQIGLTKRTLRKSGYIAQMSSWVAIFAVMFASSEPYSRVALSVIFLPILIICFLCMRVDEERDVAAERSPGTRSLADNPSAASGDKRFGALVLGVSVCSIPRYLITMLRPEAVLMFIIFTLLGLSCLYLGYLVRTPPASPKPKTEEVPDVLPSRA